MKVESDIENKRVKLNPTRFTAQDVAIHNALPPDVQAKVREYITSTPSFEIFEVTDFCYVVKTAPSNFSYIDFVHVTRMSEQFKCARGSNCDRFSVTVSKKTNSFSLCPHEHLIGILINEVINESESLNESNLPSEEANQKQQAKPSKESARNSPSTPVSKEDE